MSVNTHLTSLASALVLTDTEKSDSRPINK
jgi:hypothetical protein